MRQVLIVNNSYSDLENFPEEVMSAVDEVLTVHSDIEHEKAFLIKQIQYFETIKDKSPKFKKAWGFNKKKLKDLLATEYVHHLKGNKFPTGLLNIVKDVLELLHPQYELKDLRTRPEKRHDFLLCKDFPTPRYFQEEIHQIAIPEGRGVVESCVGSGKTLIAMRIIKDLGVNSLIVVPSKGLLEQWQPILEEHFGSRQVIRLGSGELSVTVMRKVNKRPIRIINIQALAAIRKKGLLTGLLEKVECVIFDEFHHSGSKSYTDLLNDLEHIYHRFGFTGTFLRNDSKTLDMWGVLSTKLYTYKATQAIKDGFLTPVKLITHEISGTEKRAYQSEYRANYCGNKGKRPEPLLQTIRNIFSKYVKKGDQVLILVKRKDQCGKIIHDFLNELGLKNEYISGDSPAEEVTEALRAFNEKEIKILIGSAVIGEGINVKSADHLLMCQGEKSEVSIVQAVGRLVRLSPGKRLGYIHDFNFTDTKYLTKHYGIRREIYKRNFEA